MRKCLLISFCLIIFSIFLIGCDTNTNKNKLKLIRNHDTERSILGMGLDYDIENIKKGKYEVNFYAQEYKKGEFVKEHRLYNLTLNIDSKNKKVPVSIYQESKNINLFIDENSQDITLDFFEDSGMGIALSGIEVEKKLKLNKDVPVAIYSIEGDDNSVSIVDIEGDYELGSNEKDLVIFMKITQNN
ncbi:hypothetical protein GCM10008904_10680 [Paraclostridium ghonii]|uniref:Lipoprotein n=1 Tax=Paraclostridium ghonii TaxID=29358 RepID=A0ABU0MYA8_9FIRM|nr:hypothetical protein [Paeniclostridium ghonii]MDQ0555902.1 hypothetical protein [Paeniclostridium ghonii]